MSTYELWVIKKCKCRFISFNKFNTLLNDIDNRVGYGCRKVGSIWEIYNFLLNLVGNLNALLGFPDGASDKEPVCQYRRQRSRFDPWIRKNPWKRAQQPTPAFLPGESHGQRSLLSYCPQGRKELYLTEVTQYTHMQRSSKKVIFKKKKKTKPNQKVNREMGVHTRAIS